MNVLILGGTRFIGRHIVGSLLAGGHRVSVFSRGESRDELPGEVERLRGDRDLGVAGLGALNGRAWDACVDVSGYTAVHVRSSAEMLRGRVGRYVYISTVSTYLDPSPSRPVREESPLVPPIAEHVTEVDGDTYGGLKVTCEGIVRGLYPDAWTVLRPQIVAGPHDTSGRYPYWVWRAAQSRDDGASMLVPGDGTDHVQVIDVRDLARFARLTLEKNLNGVFNMAGPRLTWGEFVRMLGAKNTVWVPAEKLAELDPLKLPLFRPEHGKYAGLMDVSSARAAAAGLTLTDPAVTMRDTLAWMRERGLSRPEKAMTSEEESGLMSRTGRH